MCILAPVVIMAASPTGASKFVISNPADSVVGTPVTVTIEAKKSNNQVDTSYQNDVTLVTSGSATGAGLVDIVNGIGTIEINDTVAETVTLSLSDTEGTGLTVSSTQDVIFNPLGSGVWRQSDFWLRDDDGSETGASGWGIRSLSANVVPDLTKTPREEIGIFRLRFGIRLTQADDSIAPQLEYKLASTESDNCADTSGWQTVSSSSGRYVLVSSAHISDSSSTTQQITAGSGFVSGLVLSSTNPAPSVTISKNGKTEYEWVLQDAGPFVFRDRYIFRITNAGAPLDTYQNCPEIHFPPESSALVTPTIVSFSGKAFPGGKILIVDKDVRFERVLSQEDVAGNDGAFSVDFVGVLESTHGFGIIVKDEANRSAQSGFFNVNTVSNSLTAKDIVVPPTVDFISNAVTRGRNAIVTGYAAPQSGVIIEVDGKEQKSVAPEESGLYKIPIDTGPLNFGSHRVRVKQVLSDAKQESGFSGEKVFVVSSLERPKTDLNGDDTIDIKDWSIFLSRWNEKNEAVRQEADLNGDGKVDISDFSIFIRAVKRF